MDTVVPRSVPTDFDVVLTGAGISLDQPSGLPAAWQLAAHVWSELHKSVRNYVNDDIADHVAENLWRLRMEQFLELITAPGTIPTEIVVDVYRLVGGGAYNRNHLRIAALDTRHFTLNMDVLLEDAAPGVNVTHLHGKWNQPKSILTTVSHYSAGLAEEVQRDFGAAIHDANVLVIGYSGRDTDVIPLFDKYPPKRIVWVAPYRRKWEYEALELQRAYDRGDYGPDREFVPMSIKAGRYLPSLVPRVPTPPGTTTPVDPPEIRTRLENETNDSQRLIAVGAVLFDLGLYDAVLTVLEPLSFADALEIQRRKIVARVLSRRGQPQRAMNLLLRLPGNRRQIRGWAGNATEVAALGPRTAWPTRTLGGVCQKLVLLHGALSSKPAPRRRRMLAQIRDAKRLAIRGKTSQAVALARRTLDIENLDVVFGEASLVDALTWEADALKSRGDLREAETAAHRADRLGVYSNFGQAAYAKWKLVEVRGLAGPAPTDDAAHFRRETMTLLTDAVDLAELHQDQDRLAWLHGTWAELIVDEHPRLAQRHIDAARDLGADDTDRDPFGRSYHLLQAAAVLVRRGRLAAAADPVERALELERQGRSRVPSARLQAEQLRAEIMWRQDSARDFAADLDRLASSYRKYELLLGEARARVAAAALRGSPVPSEVLERAEESGWWELLRCAKAGAYPWSWPLLF